MVAKEKVVVAMSGGVDSSVAAALLVEQGYSVSGIMLKLWSDEQSCADNSCCPPEAIAQARQVAGILDIPFYVLDVRELFKKEIVDEFISSYRSGITPNPCFACNRFIRWGFLLDRVLDTGAERIATGHYARVKEEDGIWRLLKGVDPSKDQSYVLAGLNQKQLARSIFPLGEMRKTDVRALAKKLNLPVAEKHDSQDLCFVGVDGYRNFINRIDPESFKPGLIRSTSGEVIGKHEGLANYTIGQRKGLGAGFERPIYVLDKDVQNNELIAGYAEELGRDEFSAQVQEWSPAAAFDGVMKCEVKTRYKSALVHAKVGKIVDNRIAVKLETTQRDITPGQIAVFYQGDYVIGSALIETEQFSGESK
jgi:tRNA-uridine 2-sulfurtransferase